MITPNESWKSRRLLVASAIFAAAAVSASGCDHLDDIVEDILKARDGGAAPDGGPAPPPNCTVNADCRLTSDYCSVCECGARGIHDPAPGTCGVPPVQCLVPPCMNKAAICEAGRCVVKPARPSGSPCLSSSNCAANEFCTAETGTCNAPPGCDRPNVACPAVCYGTCEVPSQGERCGSKTCAAGTVCCNASCGICTPPNFACTQQACL